MSERAPSRRRPHVGSVVEVDWFEANGMLFSRRKSKVLACDVTGFTVVDKDGTTTTVLRYASTRWRWPERKAGAHV